MANSDRFTEREIRIDAYASRADCEAKTGIINTVETAARCLANLPNPGRSDFFSITNDSAGRAVLSGLALSLFTIAMVVEMF